LFREHWKKNVRFVEATAEFQSAINGTTAGLLIGDRCLAFRDQARFIYDLGEEWKKYSGLPFVFAVWVSRIPLSESFLDHFDAAQARGLQQIDEVVRSVAYTSYDLGRYYKQNIHYVFGQQQQKALDYFLTRLAAGQSTLVTI
jgi:chorismate dehydratase